MGNPHTGAHMQIGDLLVNDDTAYIVKGYVLHSPKRILLLQVSNGRIFSVLKSIAKHWKPSTQDNT